MSANSRIRFGLQIVFICLYITPSHYHHCGNLFEDIEFIKYLQIYFVKCVRVSIFSQLSIIQYMGLCVFSSPTSLVMIERVYALSYHHHQIASMNYNPLFRFRFWNIGMRCMPLCILMNMFLGFAWLTKILKSDTFQARKSKVRVTGLPSDLET